ncbi:FAD-dependent oxidoreductase [Catenuloplanes atrovinosus]|uniref:2-polyprenyl-6-methoxyphenol hydroxylase-like FAD-dependent oxidoreductase n=1 Tax=Catenuloplanes atrovinosus TaxID=137266 RepID=A0AAE3YMF3_9ACTN|nr:FAD-dependent oxidoreductase [Catenuloplanes atrovinosus]MDR7274996.1 2-polyprenyl-6-methoxyphenol hydroxylase-like FAD-dependent oxidoreductase [Catenuloplanes atrovinosus]
MRTIVIGGGIAGTTAALALRQDGHEVTLYEAYEDSTGDVGAYLSLAVNGMRGLEKLGCLRAVREAGYDIPRMRFSTAAGRLLGDVPRARRGTDPLYSVTLMRGRLMAILRRAALDAGVRIFTGERLTNLTEGPDGVHAEFGSGRRDTAALLVGADGIHSTVRGLIDPSAPRAEYSGFYAVAGASATRPAETGIWNLTYGRNGAFINISIDERTQWWTAQVADPVQPELSRIDDAEWHRRLTALYPEEVPSAVLAGSTAVFGCTIMHVCAPVRTWHSGRVVLTGDAAHPVGVSQGAAMGIEDALVLVAALRTAPTIHEALAIYDAERRPRIERLLKHADDARDGKRPGTVKRHVDAFKMRLLLPFYERATGYLYDYDPTLPDARTSA